MHSPCRKLRRWLTHNEKGKKKMPDYGTDREESDRRESNSEKSHDVVFDESVSWYLPPTPDLNSNPSSDDKVSEAEMPPDEREVETLDESPSSFLLSLPNERLRRFD